MSQAADGESVGRGVAAAVARSGDPPGRNEERFRALAAVIGQAVWSWDLEGDGSDFDTLRRWWEDLTGQPVEEQRADVEAWLRMVHPDDLATAETWLRSFRSGTAYEIEYRVRARRGGWRHVRSRGVPIPGADGAAREWVGTLEDVTEQRNAAAERDRLLAEAEAERRRLEEVFRHAPSFMAVLRGPGHVFERVNDRYVELIGGRDVAGRPVREALPEIEGQGYFELLDEVYRTGEPRAFVDARVVIRRPEGLVERTIEFVYQPIRDAAGAVSGVLVQGIDLTERREAEEALSRVVAESERQRRMFDTALSHTADFVYTFDAAGRFTYANKALLDLWGKGLPEALGRDFRELGYPPELAARLQRQVREVLETGRPLRDDTPYTSQFGTRLYEYIFVPVFAADGSVEAVAGSTRDVTDRTRDAEALRGSEQRYRALVTATSDSVYRMSPDWSELRQLAGRAFLAEAGGPGRPWIEAYVPPDERPRVLEAVAAAVASRGVFELEHRVYRADGGVGWIFSRAVPILGDGGEVVEWFGTASDVTRRKRAEEGLARVVEEAGRRKRLYETILSNTPDLVYVFGLDHRFVYANDVLLRMWGRTWDEAIGRNCLELGYEPWHAAMHDREIEQVVATKRPIRGEVPFSGTFGRRIYDYIFVPILGADGEVEGVAGTTRDVTERKEAEEALREADRKKGDFIALLAHELRNPLAPIRNGLQVIRISAGDPAAVEAARAMMDRQLTHMVRLVDDLLDVSRIGRSKMELRRARVTLAEVVRHAVEAAAPAIREAGHELTVALPPEPVFLDADLTRLAQVFSNLLTNSAKYTPGGGTIRVSAARSGGEVVASVRDSGIGIPASALPKIFDMFSQVDRPAERTAGGLGIGLALVKGLVEMHGGSVSAESAEGRGSTFTVRLPVAGPEAEAAAVGAPAAVAGGRLRVLVVDDNRDGALSMAEMLRLLGHEVATAHDGLEAVAAAAAFRPEVILMDVGMPRLNGLDATRRIREQPWGRSPTIIALTGWGHDNDRARTRDAGCDGHLVKPVELADLQELVRELRGRGG
ncbi:Autoinducer 2 sensor kinase/phosphatase LuxQ [Aquisphaera giovannonii]|uniref:histidine kinase n=1 Tax=Aquisphaera giovannonii TaxID=406548 RepID=A0A5B9WG59_9BACT|nr:PAS domain-containing protein [Aquisphaera giovannonii]QEH38830.1 Autoinducer 2 sensor kinase/phosphatase LuxQ [Aquisphaera giovannonii]